jgi:SAM-dependent methyltransferase
MSCGLLQKKNRRFVGHSNFYEKHYQNYYERPGVEHFDRSRYVAMAEWMKSALGSDFAPRSILDVGCGAGWSMQLAQQLYPAAKISGVEPSMINAGKAQSAGFEVVCDRFGDGAPLPGQYDLVYSNNVLQHVTNLQGFFGDLAASLVPDGRIAMILPDASNPSNEMLWSDHNFSLRPSDVVALSTYAGLRLENWQSNPPKNSLLDKQLVILAKGEHSNYRPDLSTISFTSEELFRQRSAYLSDWRELDEELTRRIAGYKRVFNFGASMWTWLLAGYCPNYWRSISGCLVDGGRGHWIDKIVASPGEVALSKGDCIVLGVNPANQLQFERKLGPLGAKIVGWADLISR